MTNLTINAVINLKPLLNVNRFQEQNRPTLLKVAGNRYLKFQRSRFIANASGGGSWAALARSTIQAKTRRGIAADPEWILREYDVLLNELAIKVQGKQLLVGYVRNRSHPSGKSVYFLVRVHTRGTSRIPSRKVISEPTQTVLRGMVQDIRDEYNKVIRRERRAR